MFSRRLSLLAAALLLTATVVISTARAQNAPVADFSLTKADNSTLALSSLSGKKAVVVVFVNGVCPFSKLYEGRLTALASQYSAQGVEFLFVNAPIKLEQSMGSTGTDKVKMKTEGADLAQYTDAGLKAATLLGVRKTPAAVVLQPGSGGFVVRYRGAIDDNPQMESYVKSRHLKSAIDAVLAGKTAALADKDASGGCLINFD